MDNIHSYVVRLLYIYLAFFLILFGLQCFHSQMTFVKCQSEFYFIWNVFLKTLKKPVVLIIFNLRLEKQKQFNTNAVVIYPFEPQSNVNMNTAEAISINNYFLLLDWAQQINHYARTHTHTTHNIIIIIISLAEMWTYSFAIIAHTR